MPSSNARPLSGITALVTGGGSGLGRAFAVELARCGARVGVVGRRRQPLEETVGSIREVGGQGVFTVADVTDLGAVESSVDVVRQAFGPVCLLVNNAGTVGPVGPDWEVDAAAWWRALEVNLLGAHHTVRTVIPDMRKGTGGRIINVSSSAAYNPQPFYTAYAASKAALSHWSTSLARAVEPHGIRVFSYAPGFVRTPMTEFLASSPEALEWVGEGIANALSEGRDVPISRAAQVLVDLAGGRLDRLAGRHIDARDDPDNLLRSLDRVREGNLYVLGRATLD